MEEKYEIQIEYIQGNNSLWISMVDQENKKIYLYDSEEAATASVDKVQIECGGNTCRVVKAV